MRKLKLQMQVSLDGFVAGPDGEMGWLIQDWDEELNDYVTNLTAPVDCILLGRILAEGFIPAWEGMLSNPETADAAHKMVDTPKVVFSKTLTKSTWNNAVVASGDTLEEINKLKTQPGGDIIVYGGARFVSSLIQHQLIDEYHLFMNPTILGRGMPIFENVKKSIDLQLVSSRCFSCGVAALCYIPAQKAS